MKKNTGSQVIGAQMVSATDGSAFTGSVTVYVTGDAGTQAVGSVGSGACTHEGNGFHTYAPAQAETNYNHVAFTFTGSGAVPATVQVYTVSYDRHDTVRLGLTALPNAAAAASGGLLTAGTGSNQISTSSGAVLLQSGTGTGQVSLSSGLLAWNPAWDAEVESECTDALNSYDPPTNAEMVARTLVAASYATNTITTGTATIVTDLQTQIGAAGAGLTAIPWNSAWDAQVQSEVEDGLAAYDPPTKTEMDSAFTEIKGGTWNSTTDTLEAIRDRGDSAWITATGFSTLDAGDIRDAVGLSSANLDTQLSTIDSEIGAIDGIVDAILADTGTDGVVVASIASGAITSTSIATDAIGSAEISAAACNKIADHTRRRTQANVEDSSDGDALSISSEYGLIQLAQESNTEDNAGYLTVYRTDGSTELAQKPITTDATADPITGIS